MQLGSQVEVAGRVAGVATLTGLGLGVLDASSHDIGSGDGELVRPGRQPLESSGRWVGPGVFGFGLLGLTCRWRRCLGFRWRPSPAAATRGRPTALIGDMGDTGRRGRRLGILFTVGDLAERLSAPCWPMRSSRWLWGFGSCITFSVAYCCCSSFCVAPLRRALGRPARRPASRRRIWSPAPRARRIPAACDPYC